MVWLAIVFFCLGIGYPRIYTSPMKNMIETPECKLVLSSDHPELVDPMPATYTGDCGKTVVLTARSNENYDFNYWEGVDDSLKYQSKITILIDRDMKVVGHFKPKERKDPKSAFYTKDPGKCLIVIDKIGEGTVTPSPGENQVLKGHIISLQAKPAPGWSFREWQGDISARKTPLTIEIIRNMRITALFQKTGEPTQPTEVITTEPLETKGSTGSTASKGENKNTAGSVITQVNSFPKLRIARGTPAAEAKLSDYLYYFSDRQFQRIDTSTENSTEYPIPDKDKRINPGKNFTTFIYPNEDDTGNRYIVFYDPQLTPSATLLVYDKLRREFTEYDRLSEAIREHFPGISGGQAKEFKISRVYPVDYSAGGNESHVVFIAIYKYNVMEKLGDREKKVEKLAAILYAKNTEGQVTSALLVKDALSHYYNPYETKLAWLKQTPGKAETMELQVYDVFLEEIATLLVLPGSSRDKKNLLFMAYGYVVIDFYNLENRTHINRIYRKNQNQPLEEYTNARLFSKSLRHNQGEFHLLVSGNNNSDRSALLHHKEYYLNSTGVKLKEGKIPGEILRKVNDDRKNEIESVLFLLRINTYYICIIKRKADGYDVEAFKLSENFEQITGKCERDPLPPWLIESGTLEFISEGNIITAQKMGQGYIKGIVYIDKASKLKFKPQ